METDETNLNRNEKEEVNISADMDASEDDAESEDHADSPRQKYI